MTDTNGLSYLRHCAQISQARMAEQMGMPIRTYEDIEAGRSVFRPVHMAAAKWALLEIALEKSDLGLLPLAMQDFVRGLAALTNEQPA